MKRIVSIIYVTILFCLSFATMYERKHGTPQTVEMIYGAWWFFALWAMLVATGIAYIIQQHVRKALTLLLHLAFVVILLGAALTHFFGIQGVICIDRTMPTDVIYTSQGDPTDNKLPFKVVLNDFSIDYYEGSMDDSDYRSTFSIIDEGTRVDGKVSMNNIFEYKGIRFYQSGYSRDEEEVYLSINNDPWGITTTYIGYALLFISLLWMLIDPRGQFRLLLHQTMLKSASSAQVHRIKVWGMVVLAIAVTWIVYSFIEKYDPETNHVVPVLRSRLLPIHVGTIILSYCLLMVTFVISVCAVVRPKWGERLQAWSRLAHYPAMTFLGIGIFVGAIWANISWGNYWSWDPKETWALVTLMIYGIPLHRASLPKMREPKTFHVYMLLAFLSVLITYFGVNLLMGGMHSYA